MASRTRNITGTFYLDAGLTPAAGKTVTFKLLGNDYTLDGSVNKFDISIVLDDDGKIPQTPGPFELWTNADGFLKKPIQCTEPDGTEWIFVMEYGDASPISKDELRAAGTVVTPSTTLQGLITSIVNSALSGFESLPSGGTVSDYLRGDQAWADFDTAAVAAVQPGLNLKANIESPAFTGTVSGITSAMVGLGNVDNTSDADKPVSTAQQTALNGKQATLVSGTNIKTVKGISLLGSGDIPISITINEAISGGTANRVLIENPSNQLANGFFYDGTDVGIGVSASLQANLHVKASADSRVAGLFSSTSNQTASANVLEARMYDGVLGFSVGPDGSCIFGRSYDYANLKHAAQHKFQYSGGGAFPGKGLAIEDQWTGAMIRIHAIAGHSMYVTNDTGSPAAMLLGVRVNPGDNTEFRAVFGHWYITGNGSFGLGEASTGAKLHVVHPTEQIRAGYSSSIAWTATTTAGGLTTFAATGGIAAFKFNSSELSFFNVATVTRPTTATAAAAFVAGTSGIADDSATFGGYTIGQIVAAIKNLGLLT